MSAAHLPSRLEPLVSPAPMANALMEACWYILWRSDGLLMGCHLSGHIFPLPPTKCHHIGRCSGSPAGWAEQAGEVRSTQPQLHTGGHQDGQVTGKAKFFSYLRQCLSVTVQQGNATAVMGTVEGTTSSLISFLDCVSFECVPF